MIAGKRRLLVPFKSRAAAFLWSLKQRITTIHPCGHLRLFQSHSEIIWFQNWSASQISSCCQNSLLDFQSTVEEWQRVGVEKVQPGLQAIQQRLQRIWILRQIHLDIICKQRTSMGACRRKTVVGPGWNQGELHTDVSWCFMLVLLSINVCSDLLLSSSSWVFPVGAVYWDWWFWRRDFCDRVHSQIVKKSSKLS